METQSNISCPSCGHGNRANRRFCTECGGRLGVTCPACGAPIEPGEKFCGGCGAALTGGDAPRPTDAGTRKVVTIVFADLIGSTSLQERLDPESVSRLMDRYYQAVRAPVEAQGGTVVHLLGDGVMCAFGIPQVTEDDAIRAVRAAVGIQQAFRAFAGEAQGAVGTVGLRVAVNTGEVVVSDEHPAGIGDPLNVAARLQQEAKDGDVLIGEATQRLVREVVTLAPFGVLTLKGRAETVAAYRVVSLDRPAVSAVAFVGRDDELRRLIAVYDAAVAARGARLAVILGSPGLGKSRLMDEFARRLGNGATVVTAHCNAAGGATFAPLVEALRMVLGVDDAAGRDEVRTAIEGVLPRDDADRTRITDGVAALVVGTPASPEETFFVVRRLLAELAATRPVVLAIDDLQWAAPLLLDLTEHLVQWSTGVPLFVLVAARPELRDTRSSLAAPGRLVSDVVTLGGLDAAAATQLAANIIGADALPAALAGRVLTTSEGNPLFLGELVRMLVNDGTLKREGDRWTTGVEVAALEMPPTIHALLAARIERLRPPERTVLERAAVVGRQFSRAALAQLVPREITDLDARLEALKRSELIEPDAGWFLGEPVLRFHHVLIRDAAYRRVLKGTRAELHARFADWLEAKVGDAVEHDETLGWHLEQAHQNLRELGPVDERGRSLGERGARYLAAAGRRALARDDVPVAASLLGRALARLDETDPARADLALDWCEALLASGDVATAAKAIAELGRFADGSDRLRGWHTCLTSQHAVLTDPQSLRATVEAVAAAADMLARADDAAGEAKAHHVHAMALARLGRVGECEAALDRALAAARRGDDRRRSNAVLAGAPLAALSGPSPVTRASGRCLDVVRVLRITQGAPAVEAVALRCQGVLEALRGRTEAARRMIAASRRMVEELGITHRLLEADMFAGRIELLEGDAAAAERCLRPAYEGLREHGLGIDAAQAAALLGRALLAQGRAAEAEALSHESEALAGDDLQAAIAWRGVRAEALARRGEHASAVQFARAAVDIAAATDALLDHADARLALAAALREGGRSHEAAAEEARAIELWEAKGATLLAERARRDGGSVARVDHALGEVRPVRRRVQANAASAHAARLDAAIAARDADALPTLFADDLEVVHHPTGAEHGREGVLFSWRSLLKAQDPTSLHEPLATLGDSLGLYRMSWSASGAAGGKFDVGAYQRDQVILIEVDPQGRRRRSEVFAADRLSDAVARLYGRYADLLPHGPERARAAATARSVAALPLARARDLEREAAAIAPDLEYVDHRTVGLGSVHGAEAMRTAVGALLELSEDFTTRLDDILALRSDALLVRWTHFGTDRASGGTFERRLCHLWVFGVDGLVTRGEQWDADREDEALARFEEVTAEPAAVRFAAPPRAVEKRERRVRANAATATAVRLDAAIATRDADALPTLWADEYETVDHTTGTTWDLQGMLASWRSLLSAREPTCRHEPLATLGDSLALCRASKSASGFSGAKFDVGAYQMEEIVLTEVDAQGRRRRDEVFAIDRLGDAIARLYERYAGLFPDGPVRARAAATARAVVALLGPPDRWPFAPDAEAVDHRTVGFGSVRGGDAVLEAIRALLQLSDDFASHIDDVLALRSDALLVRWTTSGTVRASGGAFERNLLMLCLFGADGLLTRWEQFDTDREAEAVARFEELTAEPATVRPARRRVRPNAATTYAARVDAAFAARDFEAIPSLIAEDSELIEHTTGATYDRRGELSSFRALLACEGPVFCQEPLATLGDSLALCRWSRSATGLSGGALDVGAFEMQEMLLVEVDALGRHIRGEIFATDHLGDAIVRLYERYAEMLPNGPAGARASATARSFSGIAAFELDRWAAAVALAIEVVDHRTLGTWSARGAEAFLEHLRALLGLAGDAATRDHDVLALQPDALLVRRTHFGTARAGGGAYERLFLLLHVFAADGLVTRLEFFDSDREAEALARFDELTAGPAAARLTAAPLRAAERRRRRVRPNAATANAARLDAAIAARDADALPALTADVCEVVDHTTGATYDRQGSLTTWRTLLSARDPTWRQEPLATLGDSLALFRLWMSASGFAGARFDVGAYEREGLVLIEVDAHGRRARTEVFAVDRLDDAVARLYERYAELLPDGPARARAAAGARSIWGPGFDLDRIAASIAPAIEVVDHRTLGTWSARGAEAFLEHFRALLEVTDDAATRSDEVLGLHSDAFVVRATHSGTAHAGGGAYERQFVVLSVFGPDGLTRTEFFDTDHEDEALARFDALASPADVGERSTTVPALRFTNAATRILDRFEEAWAARDWERVVALFPPGFRMVDRRSYAQLDLDRDQHLASLRFRFDMRSSRTTSEVLATRGNRLALQRHRFELADDDVGPSEAESLVVIECDEPGVMFDPDDLDEAYAELDRRYATGEAAPYARTWGTLQRLARAVAARDWQEWASVFEPELVLEDHRPIGFDTVRSRDELLASVRALVDLAPDVTLRSDHVLALDDRRTIFVWRWTGSRDGGPFEIPILAVWVLGPDARIQRIDNYNPEQIDAARARFEAIRADAAYDPRAALARPNAASAAGDRLQAALAARDWAAMRALCAPGTKFEDRGRRALVSGDVDWWIADVQEIASMPNTRFERQLVGTAGDRVALDRILLSGDPGGGAVATATARQPLSSLGPFEIEALWVTEVDESGRITAGIAFDVDDGPAAYREARARWFVHDAQAAAVVGPDAEFIEAFNAHDRARARAVLADDFIVNDHRLVGVGLIESADAYVDSLVALWDLAPDIQIEPPVRLALERYGVVQAVRGFGTLRDGGPFERPLLSVSIVSSGRVTRLEFFEIEDVDAALARFAELRPDPLRIPPNAATRACDRMTAAGEAQDWDAFRALSAPALDYDDRRRGLRTSGDVETWLASTRYIFSHGARAARTVLATWGDRLALHRNLWTGAEDRPAFEIDTLTVTEVDAEGRIVARILFDPDDRRAASAELLERYARSDTARVIPAAWFEMGRALHNHDLERCRAVLPGDFAFHNHRRMINVGQLEAADEYIASLAALFEQSSDVTSELLYIIASENHGLLAVGRTFGTLAEGGGEFESLYVRLSLYRRDRYVGLELFDLEDLAVARARFEALRPPDPMRIPPNAAWRARDRIRPVGPARDSPALRALVSDDFVFDDRSKRALVTGGVELWIESWKQYAGFGGGYERELIATFGERIALDRLAWGGDADGIRWEMDTLRLTEVAADGRLRASIIFDLDDRRAAFAEANARFAAGEAAASGGQAPIVALSRAFDRAFTKDDWTGVPECLADDLVLRDHRILGLGMLSRDEWIASLRAQHALAPDMRGDHLRILVWNRHGRVDVQRVAGTMPDGGGPFENVFVRVVVTGGDRIRHYEVFDIGDADQAVARFEECAPLA